MSNPKWGAHGRCWAHGLQPAADTKQRRPSSGYDHVEPRQQDTGEEGLGREVGVGELDLDLLRLTSLGGGESRSAQYTGTKALMLAILEDGIRSYLSPVGRVRSEAEYWVKADGSARRSASSSSARRSGSEPDAVRIALERLRARNVSPRRAIGRSRPNVRRTGRLVGGRRTG